MILSKIVAGGVVGVGVLAALRGGGSFLSGWMDDSPPDGSKDSLLELADILGCDPSEVEEILDTIDPK